MYSVRKLIGLLVVTASGTKLGHIGDVALLDKMTVANYIVRTKRFGGKELVVAPTQVLNISTTEMTVEDTTTPEAISTLNPEIA